MESSAKQLKSDGTFLSIIIPVYNVGDYLERCLDSLISTKGIEETEVIIVDDGSNDISAETADSYSSEYGFIKCFHKTNGGLSDARNYGLDQASGKYVFFLDSDDMVIPEGMQKALELLKITEADVVMWDGISVNEDDLEIRSGYEAILTHGGLPQNKEYMSGTEAVAKQIKDHGKYAVTAWLLAARRDYLLEHNLLFEPGLLHEDELWTPQVICGSSKVLYLPEKVYCYRIREGSITGSAPQTQDKHIDSYVRVMEQLYSFFQNKIEDPELRKILLSNWADKYLWEIKSFRSCTKKRIPRKWIFKASRGVKHKLMSLVLLIFGVKVFCFAIRVCKSFGKGFAAIKRIAHYIRNIRKYQAVMFNSPVYENLGDQAIFLAEEEYCNANGIRLFDCAGADRLIPLYARLTPKSCLVLISGGGNMGELWMAEELKIRKIIRKFKKNRIVVFPQTVYWNLNTEDGRKCFEESKACYGSHPDLTVFVREKTSLEFMHENMPEVKTLMVPDMTMILERHFDKKRNGILLCMRSDKEKTVTSEEQKLLAGSLRNRYKVYSTDTCYNRIVDPASRKALVERKLERFASAELVITDRLHGMIFAYITHTPCIALDSLSHKIKGCHEWIKDAGYIGLAGNVPEALSMADGIAKAGIYDNRDKIKEAMLPVYQELHGIKPGDKAE